MNTLTSCFDNPALAYLGVIKVKMFQQNPGATGLQQLSCLRKPIY